MTNKIMKLKLIITLALFIGIGILIADCGSQLVFPSKNVSDSGNLSTTPTPSLTPTAVSFSRDVVPLLSRPITIGNTSNSYACIYCHHGMNNAQKPSSGFAMAKWSTLTPEYDYLVLNDGTTGTYNSTNSTISGIASGACWNSSFNGGCVNGGLTSGLPRAHVVPGNSSLSWLCQKISSAMLTGGQTGGVTGSRMPFGTVSTGITGSGVTPTLGPAVGYPTATTGPDVGNASANPLRPAGSNVLYFSNSDVATICNWIDQGALNN